MKRGTRLRDIRKIAIISWGFWGDCVILTPLIDALRRLFPGVRIVMITGAAPDRRRAHAGLLFQKDPRVNSVLITGSRAVAALIRGRRCDLAIDLVNTRWTRILVKASGARHIICAKFCQRAPHFFTWLTWGRDGQQHIRHIRIKGHIGHFPACRSQQILKIARFINNGRGNFRSLLPKLFISRSEQRWARDFLHQNGVAPGDTIIGLQPGGAWPHRLWPAGYYGRVARFLARREKTRILIFFARGERRGAQNVRKGSRAEVVLIGERDARRYMALLSQCHVFISSDGGPLHVALASGVPCVGLFKNKHEKNAAHWYDWRARKNLLPVFFPKGSPREESTAVVAAVETILHRPR